jgi:hypothetical protein
MRMSFMAQKYFEQNAIRVIVLIMKPDLGHIKEFNSLGKELWSFL